MNFVVCKLYLNKAVTKIFMYKLHPRLIKSVSLEVWPSHWHSLKHYKGF